MIHLVIGRQGSGKTIFLVKKGYEAYLKGKKIYSNIALNFPYKPIDYNDIINCKYENAVVLLDEGHLLLSSRRCLSKTSIQIVDNFISQVRKKKLELYITTQTLRKIDIRIREERDYLYMADKYVLVNGEFKNVLIENYDKDLKTMINLEVQDNYSLEWITYSFIANEYYKLYDTTQIIQITGIK